MKKIMLSTFSLLLPAAIYAQSGYDGLNVKTILGNTSINITTSTQINFDDNNMIVSTGNEVQSFLLSQLELLQFTKSTGIKDVAINTPNGALISYVDDGIRVTSSDAVSYELFSTSGVLLDKRSFVDGFISTANLQKGVYILRVGNSVFKIKK